MAPSQQEMPQAGLAGLMPEQRMAGGGPVAFQFGGGVGAEFGGEAVVEKRSGDDWQLLSAVKPGQTFGEMAIVDQLPRSARVRAVTNCLALNLKASRLESSPEVAAVIYRNIAAMQTMRLRAANEALSSRPR